jgi:Reverse transcriptase (RNA-dependent DNA polymerase)
LVLYTINHKIVLGADRISKHILRFSFPERLIVLSEDGFEKIEEINKTETTEVIHRHAKFFEEPNTLPSNSKYDCKLIVQKDIGAFKSQKNCPTTTEEDNELKRFVSENIKSGKIKGLKGLITSPLLFVRKKEGTLRICVDYRQINDYVCKDAYPLPRIDTVLKNILSYDWFTRLDLRDAYLQLRMHPDSEWLTTLSSKYSSYSFRVMSFGLSVAPSYFQRFVNKILEEFFVRDVIAYHDDILIPSKPLKDNIKLTHRVIEKLLKHNLLAKIQKCEFFACTTQFLGYNIGSSSLGIKEGAVTR